MPMRYDTCGRSMCRRQNVIRYALLMAILLQTICVVTQLFAAHADMWIAAGYFPRLQGTDGDEHEEAQRQAGLERCMGRGRFGLGHMPGCIQYAAPL